MISDLLEIARRVRSAVCETPLAERSASTGMGADGTPTSRIDRIAEDVIIDFMEKNDFHANLLSEEAGHIDRGFDTTLVADPVDGTFNACAGIPFYSVSLALGSGSLGGITDALVMNLVTGDTFEARKGGGATFNGKPIHVREPEGDLLLMAYLGASAQPKSYAVAHKFKRVRSLGCVSLELCAVACGQADAFFIDYGDESKRPRIIDIAAAILILREAGGEAHDANKEILEMPLSLSERKNLVAAGSRKVLELME